MGFIYLSEQKDKGSKVEDVHHANQPVEEHGGARSRVEALLSVFKRGIKHLLPYNTNLKYDRNCSKCANQIYFYAKCSKRRVEKKNMQESYQRTNVQPPTTNEWKQAYLHDNQQGDLGFGESKGLFWVSCHQNFPNCSFKC